MFLESKAKRRIVRVTVWVAVLGLLLGVLSTIIGVATADAHASLKLATPADGAQLTSAPRDVVLVFDEPVSTSFATVTVTGPSGSAIEGRAQVVGDTVTQPLAGGLSSGTYTVAFRVVSDDGHPVSGQSRFTLSLTGAAGSATPTSVPTMTPLSSGAGAGGADESATAARQSGSQKGQAQRVGLAVGVAALAVAMGIALVAGTRRRRPQ